jgi:hypothetical protein
VALGPVFLLELWFPLPIYIPSASPQSSSVSPEAGTIGQEWPQCQKPHKPNKEKAARSVYSVKNLRLVPLNIIDTAARLTHVFQLNVKSKKANPVTGREGP